MKRLILDTNAVMAIVEFKLDLFSELERQLDFNYQLAVLQGTVSELQKIQNEQRGKFSRGAKLVLAILKAKKVKVLEQEGNVDDALAELSKHGDLILTQDFELKKRLTKPYLTIRQKRKIIVIDS